MFLVSNFRTVVVLLCLITSWLPPTEAQTQVFCWTVDPEALHTQNAFIRKDPCNDPGQQKCGIKTDTGYGVKCKSTEECPPGDYSDHKVVCGSGYGICCCDSYEDKVATCNDMTDYRDGPEACKNPELQNSDMCRPSIVCLDSKGKRVTCDKPPGQTPFCKMEPGTGQGMGCGALDNNVDCSNVDYPEKDMVCQDGKCCCKGNDKEPCNILTEQSCLLDEFKELEECKNKVTTTSTKTEPGPGGKPGTETGNGCGEEGQDPCSAAIGTLGYTRLVMGMLVLSLLLVSYH